jgi:ferredoxin
MVFRINDDCLNCGACLDQCPSSAIIEENEQYVINLENCTECGTCIEVCPAEAIAEE